MKHALLVIDLQNDYLWQKRHPRFSYPTESLIERVNQAIAACQEAGWDIVYLSHLVQNTWANRKLFGYSIVGTEGAKLYPGLHVVSEYCFDKYLPSAFTSKKFAAFVQQQGYEQLAICGIDEGGCVSATAMSACKAGISVAMLTDCIDTVFPLPKVEEKRAKLRRLGAAYTTTQALLQK